MNGGGQNKQLKAIKRLTQPRKSFFFASVPQVRDQETLLIDPDSEELKLWKKLVRK